MTFAEQVLTLMFLACSAVCWMNVRALARDKCIKGCSLFPAYVFLTTNIYEVFYFQHIHQSLATLGALSMAVANVVWLGLAIMYRMEASIEDNLTY